MFEKKN